MNPESKENQPSDEHEMFTASNEETKRMFTDCLVPTTTRSDDAQYKLRSDLEDLVTVKNIEQEQANLWKLDDPSESKIGSMRNWNPKITCLASCKCYPAQALQVYELTISCKEDYEIWGEAWFSGFFAIRDYYDRRRIYIVNNHEMRNPASTIKFTNGVGKMGITTPYRGILYDDLVFDFDMKIEWSTEEGSKEETIAGKALYEGKSCPYSSHAKIIQASIPIHNDSAIKEMNIKFVRFPQAIESEIQIQPPNGFNFRLTARMGDIADEIVLFDGEYNKQPSGARDHKSLKYVLVVPFLDILELKFTSPDHTDEGEKMYTFNSFYHGFCSKDIYFGSSCRINMKITWSRM